MMDLFKFLKNEKFWFLQGRFEGVDIRSTTKNLT